MNIGVTNHPGGQTAIKCVLTLEFSATDVSEAWHGFYTDNDDEPLLQREDIHKRCTLSTNFDKFLQDGVMAGLNPEDPADYIGWTISQMVRETKPS